MFAVIVWFIFYLQRKNKQFKVHIYKILYDATFFCQGRHLLELCGLKQVLTQMFGFSGGMFLGYRYSLICLQQARFGGCLEHISYEFALTPFQPKHDFNSKIFNFT
jgi:hypothetical protein